MGRPKAGRTLFPWRQALQNTMCLQEAGGSEEDIQLAVARAHERMLQAELAESQAPAAQAGPSEPQQQQPARGGRPPPDGSRAASSRQAEQVRVLNRLEVRTQDTLFLSLAGMGCSQSFSKHYPHIHFSLHGSWKVVWG